LNYFNYFSEIEAAFIRRRGRNLLLSPLDWDLIETWQERDIPLQIVIRAIEDVFDAYDKKETKRRAIKSLSYCKDEVEARHEEWIAAQTGKSKSSEHVGGVAESKPETFSKAAIEEHFDRILAEFTAAKNKFVAESIVRLEKVESDLREIDSQVFTAEKLEDRLEELDKTVDEILLESEHSAPTTEELSKNMSEYKTKMDAAAFERTFKLMLLKQLRDDTGIPRFSLFYL
jgi:signal recognition particle GTPase